MKKIFLILIIGVIITGTIVTLRTSKSIDKNLSIAEKLMTDRSDSALHVLKILNAKSFKGENKALYALLMTQAQFKNYKPVRSDSLIKIAYEYYIDGDDSLKKAQTYLYQGRVDEIMKKDKEALNNYQKASIAVSSTNNYKLLALIYSRWGIFFRKQNLYDEALNKQIKALKFAENNKDTLDQIFILKEIGSIYSFNQKYDQALFCYMKALKLAEFTNNKSRISGICNSIGLLYKSLGKYNISISYVNKSLSLLSDSSLFYPRYSLKGSLFTLVQQYDSAKYYLNLSKRDNNFNSKATYYSLMSKLEEKQENFKDALFYSNSYIKCIYKIIDSDREKAIAELQKKYDYTLIKNENNELKISRQHVQIITLAISLIALVSIILSLYYFYRKRSVKRAMKLELDKMQHNLMNEKSNYYKEKTIEAQRNLIKEQELGRELSLKTEALKIHQEREKELKEHIFQMETVVKKIDAFNSMKPLQRIKSESQFTLTYQELCNLEEAMNLCHEQFAARLRANYPKLKDNDVHLCCLLKLKVPGKNIMGLLNLSELTLKKRKYRIKHEKMEMPGSVTSLDDFLCSF